MRPYSLLNFKEYLHFIFLISVFIGLLINFDLTNDIERAYSLLIVIFVGGLYYFKNDPFKMNYWSFTDERKTTNYEIVGPFGMVFVAGWIAVVDFMTPDVISKYSGLILLATIINALDVNSEISRRAEERFMLGDIVLIHKAIIWFFFIVLYFIATKYFLTQGEWKRGIPEVSQIIKITFERIN